jgi:hypothetical protein
MTTTDKVEIRVRKLRAVFFVALLLVFIIGPFYLVDFTELTSKDINLIVIYPAVSVLLLYLGYKYSFKRILMGPIITLTKEAMIVKDDDTAHTYRWTTIKKAKVEVVTQREFNGENSSRTMLIVWTTTRDASDEFNISDLELNADQIRDLIRNYQEGTAANIAHMPAAS